MIKEDLKKFIVPQEVEYVYEVVEVYFLLRAIRLFIKIFEMEV